MSRSKHIKDENEDTPLDTQNILAEDIAKMLAELEKLKNDAEESQNRYLRTLADFDNFRKRQREETSRVVSFAREEVLSKVLKVADNFERALSSASETKDYDTLVQGIEMVFKQVTDMLKAEGVEPIEAVGQEFNPELHEAMIRTETDDYPTNTIIEEFEKGYTLNGKVIRPSRVSVVG